MIARKSASTAVGDGALKVTWTRGVIDEPGHGQDLETLLGQAFQSNS
jgi:hypothetical protein